MLWILAPVDPKESPFNWYDVAVGFVVRAETETAARELAQARGGDEVDGEDRRSRPMWTDPTMTTCVPLKDEGEAMVILRDFVAG